MKILQINSVCGRGSTGRIATDLADVLAAHGHECRIAYGRGTVPDKYQDIAVRIGTDADIHIHGLKTRLLDAHGFGSKRATAHFLEWVRGYDPDIIHLHNIHGYYINIQLLFQYLKEVGKPIVWTLHDCWAFTGHCSYFTTAGCERWKTQCWHCMQKDAYPASLIADDSHRNFKRKQESFTGLPNMTLVTPSNWLAGLVKQSFLKGYPVEVIHNGIDLSIFKPTPSDFRERNGLVGKQILLGVANIWDSRKGLDDFIQLSSMLKDTQKIVLVGLSEKQIRTLPKGILGIRRTNSVQELAEIYSAADIFVNPSKEESQGLTTIEALACGTPVIVYDKTAIPEAVDKNCGVVISEGAENIVIAIPLVNFSADACVRRASRFEKETQFEKYLRLYETVIKP